MRREKREEAEALARARRRIDRDAALARFRALLAESVRDPEATWADALPALTRDPQGRCRVDGSATRLSPSLNFGRSSRRTSRGWFATRRST